MCGLNFQRGVLSEAPRPSAPSLWTWSNDVLCNIHIPFCSKKKVCIKYIYIQYTFYVQNQDRIFKNQGFTAINMKWQNVSRSLTEVPVSNSLTPVFTLNTIISTSWLGCTQNGEKCRVSLLLRWRVLANHSWAAIMDKCKI